MMFVLILSFVTRNIINYPMMWIIEMAQFTITAYYLLGGGYSMITDDHVRMDLFYGKLSEKLKLGKGSLITNIFISFFYLSMPALIYVVAEPSLSELIPQVPSYFSIFLVLTLVAGIGFVMPIGGGDMPVVISLLNSLSGIAAAFAGLLLLNNVLIVAGSLVGASGLILTIIMAKAMNRTITNILFVGYASVSQTSSSEEHGEVL